MWQLALKSHKVALWSLTILTAVIVLVFWVWRNAASPEVTSNMLPDVSTQEDLISQQSTELDRMAGATSNLSEEDMDRQYRELDAQKGMIIN